VGQPFTLSGCGTCTCDDFGGVSCGNPACSGPGHGAAGHDGSADTGADVVASPDTAPGGSADARDTGVNCNCGRGAFVPMCGVDGKTYDAACGTACVPVKIACMGQCPCAAGATRPCQLNSDCDAGQVCYNGLSTGCQSSAGFITGTCVARHAGSTCSQNVGGGCPCIDVSTSACNPNSGGRCVGSDDANACWSCQLPV
jgi:hypothetical protein